MHFTIFFLAGESFSINWQSIILGKVQIFSIRDGLFNVKIIMLVLNGDKNCVLFRFCFENLLSLAIYSILVACRLNLAVFDSSTISIRLLFNLAPRNDLF